MAYDERFMKRAIALSEDALRLSGCEPFGAVVVRDGEIVGEGLNRTALDHDPTAHGEIAAIRAACAHLKTLDLSGCELYSSCEPCPLCVAAMATAGIPQLYFAASLQASAALKSRPVLARDGTPRYLAVRREAGAAAGQGKLLHAEQHMSDAALDVLARWNAQQEAARG